jgi:hypothetical protein
LKSGEFIDKRLVILIGSRGRSSPGKIGHFFPGRGGRPSSAPNQVCGVGQARAVMSRDTVEKDRLTPRISQQVGSLSHLFEGGRRPAHLYEEPAYPQFRYDLRLTDVLGIVAIDRRQRHDRLDPLTGDDRPQSVRSLPSSANQTAGDDNS